MLKDENGLDIYIFTFMAQADWFMSHRQLMTLLLNIHYSSQITVLSEVP